MADYAASKAAALALHEGLQTELRNIHQAPKVRCTIVCPGTVGTKMFAGLRSSSEFIMPTLSADEVAEAIVSALWAGEARTIDLPWSHKVLFPSLRALPQWWRILMQDNAKDTMKTFGGRQIMS
jgi:short-subunit dehydrogenase